MASSSTSNIRVVVVGAGVVGCSLAMHLAREGASVDVLDKGEICAGMSSRSGALIRMHYTFPPEANLALQSLRYFQNWADVVGGGCGFVQTGYATLVDSSNVDALRANVAMLCRLGVDTEVISPDDLQRIDPNVSLENVAMAAYEPHSGYADPIATTHSFADAARRAGARFHLNTPVTSVRLRAARAIGVMDAAGRFHEADAVCLVTGPWTAPLLAPLAASLPFMPPITPERAQIAFFERDSRIRHLIYIDTISGCYFRPHQRGGHAPFQDDLTLAGIGGSHLDDADPDRFRTANDAAFIEEVRRRLGTRIPALAAAPYARGHAGIYDVTPDQRPILDEVPGLDGLYVAAGFSGTGFKTSPAVGAAMAELILNGAMPEAIAPFSFTRFMTGKLIAGEHEYAMGSDFGHTL